MMRRERRDEDKVGGFLNLALQDSRWHCISEILKKELVGDARDQNFLSIEILEKSLHDTEALCRLIW